jgi:hypothetical protein
MKQTEEEAALIHPHNDKLLLDASPLPHAHSPHHHREDRAVIGLRETLVEGAVRRVVLEKER